MSIPHSAEQEERWSRPQLERTGPVRTAGGLFRTAEGGQPGLGGVPLTTAEDAVVAAVRMAYRVAEAQVERSTRLAKRLREAGDQAVGARSDRKALDATEQLVFKMIMGVLAWLEAAAAEGDSPLKKLLVAQYRLIGSMLGLTPSEGSEASRRDAPEPVPRSAGTAAPSNAEPGWSNASFGPVRVVLKGSDRRPVRIRLWEVASGTPLDAQVQFYSTANIKSHPLKARLAIDAEGRATLEIWTQRLAPLGPWKGAVCDEADAQIGFIEIEL